MIGEVFMQKLLGHLARAESETALDIASVARALAPKASGQLAASITAQDGTVRAAAPYATAVEFRTPYLRPALLALAQTFRQRLCNLFNG
jgi:hypothetical protein